MKKLLASLLFLLPIFAFSVNSAKAQFSGCDTNVLKSDPAVITCATAFGDATSRSYLETCSMIKCVFDKRSASDNGPWYNQTPTQFAHKVFDGSPDEIFGERYTYAQINWIINSLITMINPAGNIKDIQTFQILLDSVKGILDKIKNNQPIAINDYSKMGPLGLGFGMISMLYENKPASAIAEAQNVATKFDIASPAYAQTGGYGYNGLISGGAVHKLWQATRNMSYFLMIILLIASGFLIMFRVKINPQTVISIQTMIPKLIITMILVTFSFAIAGLIIDLIYIIIGLFVALLSANGIMENPAEFRNVLGWLTGGSWLSYFYLQQGANLLFLLIGGIAIVGGILTGATGVGIVVLVAGIAIAIPAIITLITVFKICIMLLKAYVMLILQIIIGPLQIMLDLLPGQQGFGPWIRNLIANASVFVVVPIMLVVQHILAWDPFTNFALHIKDFSVDGNGANLELPFSSFLGAQFGGSALGFGNILTRMFIGFTVFAMTPKIADMIRDMLKIPAFKYESAIGEAMMSPKGVYDRFTNWQKGKDDEALRRAKLQSDVGRERSFGSGGITGVIEDVQRKSPAQQTTPKVQPPPKTSTSEPYSR